jgi:hypothetical protein
MTLEQIATQLTACNASIISAPDVDTKMQLLAERDSLLAQQRDLMLADAKVNQMTIEQIQAQFSKQTIQLPVNLRKQ